MSQNGFRMRFQFFSLCLAFGLSVLAQPSQAGDSKDDGGNVSYSALRKDLFGYRSRLFRFLKHKGPTVVAEGLMTSEEVEELNQLLKDVPLALVYEQLFVEVVTDKGHVHMVPVDAVNNKEKFYIRVNAFSWGILNKCEKSKLLLHEYATLLGRDKSLDNAFSATVAGLHMSECYRMVYEFDEIGTGWPQPSSGSMVY